MDSYSPFKSRKHLQTLSEEARSYQPTNQSINQSNNQTIDQSIPPSIQPASHPSITPSITQSINPSLHHSITPSLRRSINLSVCLYLPTRLRCSADHPTGLLHNKRSEVPALACSAYACFFHHVTREGPAIRGSPTTSFNEFHSQ